MPSMTRVLVLLAVAATASAIDLGATRKATLEMLENEISKGINKATSAFNKTAQTGLETAVHTTKALPCKAGYTTDEYGKCTVCDYTLSMVPGCNACVEPGTCSGCSDGYVFVSAADSPSNLGTGTCICDVAHLNDPNCAQCAVAGSCDQCYNGYFPNPATKVCTRCSSNCRVCDSATACNVCAEGFSLNDLGQCVPCKAGCLECVDGVKGTSTCLRCKQDLYPNTADPGSCISPAVANCLQVSESSATFCAVCDAGYSLTVDGQCVPCKAGCLECADGVNGTSFCHRCKQDLYPDVSDPGACIPAAVPNCLQVSESSATFCAVCELGFSLTVDGQCVPCKAGCLECADGVNGTSTCLRCIQTLYPDTSDPGSCISPAVANCAQVTDTSATVCAVCDQSYSLTLAGQCTPCKSGCLICANGVNGTDTCLRCIQGLFPDTNNPGTCVPAAVANCASVSASSAYICEVCDPLYALSTDATTCIPCGSGCAQCHANTSAPADVNTYDSVADIYGLELPKVIEPTTCDVCLTNSVNVTICPNGACANLQTDANNCGACGSACPAGSICQGGLCYCADNGQPVATATQATCGTLYTGTLATTTYEYTVTSGATYSGVYDSISIPDRYVIRFNSPCGPVVYDTGYTGLWNSGCLASAPCCPANLGGNCTGGNTAGTFCPPNSNGGGPPGGAGAGRTPDFIIPPTTTKLYATAFGVCTSTQNRFTLSGSGGGTCPP